MSVFQELQLAKTIKLINFFTIIKKKKIDSPKESIWDNAGCLW